MVILWKKPKKMNTPINKEIVDKILEEQNITNVGKASIREIKKLINKIENESKKKNLSGWKWEYPV